MKENKIKMQKICHEKDSVMAKICMNKIAIKRNYYLKQKEIIQSKKNQNMTKFQNSNCYKSQILKSRQKSETQIGTQLKNSN